MELTEEAGDGLESVEVEVQPPAQVETGGRERPGCLHLPKQVEHPGAALELGHSVTRSTASTCAHRTRAGHVQRQRSGSRNSRYSAVITLNTGGDSILAAEHDDLALDEEPVRLGTGERGHSSTSWSSSAMSESGTPSPVSSGGSVARSTCPCSASQLSNSAMLEHAEPLKGFDVGEEALLTETAGNDHRRPGRATGSDSGGSELRDGPARVARVTRRAVPPRR